ncbi:MULTISPECIES: putative holin-like toxin [Phascolarctobacterium]
MTVYEALSLMLQFGTLMIILVTVIIAIVKLHK